MDRTTLLAQGRFAIEEQLYRYANAVDRGDLETASAVFAKATLNLEDGRSFRGAGEVFDFYRELIIFYSKKGDAKPYRRFKTTPMTQHSVSNVRCYFNNAVTEATVESQYTATQLRKGRIRIIAQGRYADVFARDLSGWHLKSRDLHIDLTGDLSHHLKG